MIDEVEVGAGLLAENGLGRSSCLSRWTSPRVRLTLKESPTY